MALCARSRTATLRRRAATDGPACVGLPGRPRSLHTRLAAHYGWQGSQIRRALRGMQTRRGCRGPLLDPARRGRSLRALQRPVVRSDRGRATATARAAICTTRRWSFDSDGERYTIELAPSPDGDGASRGVVATGAVGSRHLGWWRLFRYEVRCWRGGTIPDLDWAVGGPRRLTCDAAVARRVLELVAAAPTPVWGRDELDAGRDVELELGGRLAARPRRTVDRRCPPALGGRAPGWDAGRVASRGGAMLAQSRQLRASQRALQTRVERSTE